MIIQVYYYKLNLAVSNIDNTKHYKSVNFELKQIQDEDPNFFSFEGYASTYSIDRDNERIKEGAFEEGLKEITPKLHIQHTMSGIDGLPIGSFSSIKFDGKGMFVSAKMPREDRRNKDIIIPQIKAGNINSMSIGFIGNEYEMDGDVKVFTKITVYEISVVGIPANKEAMITNFSKSFKEQEINTLKDVESYLKKGGMSQNEAKTLISKVKEFSQCDVEEEKAKRDVGLLTEELKQINTILTIKNSL
jgi:HK97 family phage prohead protease